jgi:hypothetical protein
MTGRDRQAISSSPIVPEIGLYTSTIRRGRGEMPQAPLVNMFLEFTVTEPKHFSLISHPGLDEEGTALGNGPVTGLFQKDGVLLSAVIGVSASELYVGGAAVGAITGAVIPSIAGNEIGAVATAGADAVFYDGTDFSAVDFPDGAAVRKVIEQGGRFLFLRDGTGAAYFTEVLADMLNGSDEIEVDGLSFFTAESEPDQLLDAVAFEDAVVFGGTATIEFWVKTGDSELPYTPSTGRVFDKGVRATGCMAKFDNTFAWVSPDHIVYRAGNVPERISDAGIEELIEASATCRVDTYFFEGHEFLKILLDGVTIEYDAQTQQWAERKTGVGHFHGGPVIKGPIFGSTENGNLLEPAAYADFDSYHERSFCVHFPVDGGAVPVNNLRLRTNPGHTDYLTGDYTDPAIELFQSYDGGQTYDTPIEENLGEQGEYRREVEWRALGFADPPGFFAKIRVTDPVSFRCSGASINEPHGGRSR